MSVAYFLMSKSNVRRQVALPWVSFGSDEAGYAPEGVFLQWKAHSRAYGNFVRVIGHYVRDEHILSMEQAIYKLAGLPADNLFVRDRGRLKVGNYADVIVFDPKTVADHATYDQPHQLASGVEQVFVNGRALKDGDATRLPSGRFVKGRGFKNDGGGCRLMAYDWNALANPL